MSEVDAQAVSGIKRPREEDVGAGETNGDGAAAGGVPEMPPADLDDSDDEIGPMPDAPSVEVSKGRKKKRAVLSHERIYLENMPDTDRYTKSFMHRADLNFVTMTKLVNPRVTWAGADAQDLLPVDDVSGWTFEVVEEAGGWD